MNKTPKNPIRANSASHLRRLAARKVARKVALLAAWKAARSTSSTGLVRVRDVPSGATLKTIILVDVKKHPTASTKSLPVPLENMDAALAKLGQKQATALLKAPRPDLGYDREQAAYATRKPGLLKTALGRFVAFVGDEMAGPYDTFHEAHRESRRHFGPGPLYIKQVAAEERIFEPITVESCRS